MACGTAPAAAPPTPAATASSAAEPAPTPTSGKPVDVPKVTSAPLPAAAAKSAQSGGLKKGFLSGGSTPRRTGNSKAVAATGAGSSALGEAGKDEMPVLHADKSKQKKVLELPEIQQQRDSEVSGVSAQQVSAQPEG